MDWNALKSQLSPELDYADIPGVANEKSLLTQKTGIPQEQIIVAPVGSEQDRNLQWKAHEPLGETCYHPVEDETVAFNYYHPEPNILHQTRRQNHQELFGVQEVEDIDFWTEEPQEDWQNISQLYQPQEEIFPLAGEQPRLTEDTTIDPNQFDNPQDLETTIRSLVGRYKELSPGTTPVFSVRRKKRKP